MAPAVETSRALIHFSLFKAVLFTDAVCRKHGG
jgi:hypothetical protein